MHAVTVVCRNCGKEFAYQTMFMSTAGIAVCPYCGVRDRGEKPPGGPSPPRETGTCDTGPTATWKTGGST